VSDWRGGGSGGGLGRLYDLKLITNKYSICAVAKKGTYLVVDVNKVEILGEFEIWLELALSDLINIDL
jgi:hypothetical protein